MGTQVQGPCPWSHFTSCWEGPCQSSGFPSHPLSSLGLMTAISPFLLAVFCSPHPLKDCLQVCFLTSQFKWDQPQHPACDVSRERCTARPAAALMLSAWQAVPHSGACVPGGRAAVHLGPLAVDLRDSLRTREEKWQLSGSKILSSLLNLSGPWFFSYESTGWWKEMVFQGPSWSNVD